MLYLFTGHVLLLLMGATNFTFFNIVLPEKRFSLSKESAWKKLPA